jgi:hypothetical protein
MDYFTALTRFLPSALFFTFLSFINPKNHNLHLKIIHYFVLFTVISGFSIFFQLFFSIEIPFLVDSSIREGLVRYGSLLGSITSFGTLGPLALFSIILFINKKKILTKSNFVYFVFALIIVSASILTLSKSAILNLILVFFFVMFFFSVKNIIFFMFLLFALSLIVFSFFGESELVKTFQTLVNYTFFNGSLSFFNDLNLRATLFISIFLKTNDLDFISITFGFGFKALSGILGLNNYIMLHNNYYDLFFSGGLLHLLSFLVLVFESLFYNLRNFSKLNNTNNNYSIYLFFSLIYFLVNMLFGGSTIYHPIGGTLLFLLILFSKVSSESIKSNSVVS